MQTQSGSITGEVYTLTYSVVTDTGLVRPHNEDAYLVLENDRIFCVADGAGGHKKGKKASSLTIKGVNDIVTGNYNSSFDDTLPLYDATIPIEKPADTATKTILIPAIHYANELCRNTGEQGLASTIVAYHFTENSLHIAHVGDSRAYSYSRSTLTLLTEDHSLVNYLFKQGEITEEEKRSHPRRNVILRAIGVEDNVKITLNTIPIVAGTLYLLCSDGLTSMLSDSSIATLMANKTRTVEDICVSLLQAANNAGGRDNTTIMLIKVDS